MFITPSILSTVREVDSDGNGSQTGLCAIVCMCTRALSYPYIKLSIGSVLNLTTTFLL